MANVYRIHYKTDHGAFETHMVVADSMESVFEYLKSDPSRLVWKIEMDFEVEVI